MNNTSGSVGRELPDTRAPANPTIDAISDDELWQLVGWRPTSPYERGRTLFPQSPNVWGLQSGESDNVPTRAWIDWAKGEIIQCDKDRVLYLCRLLRILELFHRDEVSRTPGVEMNFLCAAIVGGLAVAGQQDSIDDGRQLDVMLMFAQQQRLVLIEKIDEWSPGMPSGSGWKRYVRLTVAGQRFVGSQDWAPPPPLDNTSRESPSGPQETKTSHLQEAKSTPSPPAGHGGAVSAPATDVPAPIYYHNEKRDAWIYEECVKGTHYKEIRRQLRIKSETEGVEFVESFSGIRKAAARYAHAHGLPLPPKRQHGRPPAEKN